MTLAKTNIPPEEQVRNIAVYDDQVAAGSSMETTTGSLENNIQAVISQINRALNGVVTGNNWYVDPPTPSTFEGGTVRGTIANNQDLHDLERKRVLKRRSMVGLDVTIASAGDQYVILGAADLPSETTAAVGAVTTLGTVVALNATFGTATLDEVVGANALQPKNLMILTDNATGDVVTRSSDGRQIFGLFQSENGTDGFTITGTTPNRVQISFVVHNGANDDLELITSGDMDGITFDYAYVERHALQDLPEEAFLGEGFADTGVSAATRQAAYDNQGTAVVTTMTSATLDIGTGFTWEIGDAASAALMTFTEGSGTGTTTLAVGTDVDVYNNNAVDVNFGNGITVDSSDPINIGITQDQIDFSGNATITSTSASSLTVTTDSAALTLSTTTSGNLLVNSAGNVDVDGSSVLVDATAAFSIDGVTASNVTVTGSTLTLSTVTTGDVLVTSADDVVHSADNHLFDVTSLDTGVLKAEVNKFHWENAGGGAMYPKLNADFTSTTATTAGFVVAYDATGTSDTIAAPGFTAGVAATSNPTVQTTGAATFTAGDLILITGAAEESNNGLYEVLTHAANVLTIRGVGTTDVVEAFTDRQFVTSTSTAGAITGMNVTVLQADATGAWGSGQGSTTPITFTSFGSAGGNSLQQAYEQGNTISVSAAEGIVTLTNSTDATNVLEVSRTFAGAGIGIDLNMGASTTGVGLDVAGAGSGIAVNILASSTGDALFVNNTGTGAAFTVQDGGGDVLDVSAAGAVTVTPTSGENATITATGTGSVDINAATGGVTIDATGGAVSLDSDTASNFTVTGADLVLSTVTTGELDLTSAGLLDVNAGANLDVDVTGTFDVLSTGAFSIDGTGASNVTAASGTLTLSATTTGDVDVIAADAASIQTGTADISIISATNTEITAGTTIDLTSGTTSDITATSGNAIFAQVAELDRNVTDAAGSVRIESSFFNLESRNEGQLALNFNTGYTSATGTNNYQVFVVSGSATTDTVATGGFTAGTTGSTDATVVTTASGTFSAGQFVNITHHGGATNEKNLGIFEVLTHVGTTLTIRGPLTAPAAGAEFIRQNFATDATTGATITLVTLSVLRTSTTGNMQIAEAFSTSAAITYQDLGTGATTLSNAVTNVGTSPATQSDSFDWRITDGDTLSFNTTAPETLLSLAPAGGGDTVTVGHGTGDTLSVDTATNSFTNGASFDDGAAATTITVGVTPNTIAATGGDLTVGSTNTGPGGSATTVRTPDTGGAGVTGNLSLFAGTNANSATTGGTLLAHGSDFTAGADALNGAGAATFRAGDDVGTGALATGANATFRAGIATDGGNAFFQGGAAFTGNNGDGGDATMSGGAGDGTGVGGPAAVVGGAGGATGAGATASLTGGAGGSTSGAAGGATVSGGTPTDGNGGTVAITATAGVGTNRDGGDATITAAANTGTGAPGDVTITAGSNPTAAGSNGRISLVNGANGAGGTVLPIAISTAASANVTGNDAIALFLNSGSGTGGGQGVRLFAANTATDPDGVVSAPPGSLYAKANAGVPGELWLNDTTGTAAGTDWSQVSTTATQVSRNFFQDTFDTAVAAGNPITASDLTGGVLPVKPSANFVFDDDAMVFLNGILLMNGTGNEVTSGTGNQINIEAAGPSASIGDVLTVIYHTNSTNNTA